MLGLRNYIIHGQLKAKLSQDCIGSVLSMTINIKGINEIVSKDSKNKYDFKVR